MAEQLGGASAIRVVVIAPAESLDQDWINALGTDPSMKLLARVGVLARGVEVVEQLQPNIVLIDRSVDEIEELLHTVYTVAPQTLCIAVLPTHDMTSVRRLIAAGARDIVNKPIQGKELITSLQRTVQMEEARRQHAGLPTLLSRRESTRAGKVIVVMGPKGGVGSTTVATNLAVALKHVTGKEVVLADFSLQFGDVAVLLNIHSKHTLHDLAMHYQALDDELVERVLVPHLSGIKVLQAPSEPEMTADMGAAQVASIVQMLQRRSAYVVIDCWSFLDEITETLVKMADQVLLVTTPEVPAMKNTKQALDYFSRHGLQREQVSLVLNRFPSVKGVTLQDIQQHLRYPVQANVPSDGPAVTHAANKGIPVVQSHPQSWVAQSFLRLAAWVAGDKVTTISLGMGGKDVVVAEPAPVAKRRFGLRRSAN